MGTGVEVPGFANPDDVSDGETTVQERKKDGSKKGGGFQCMGLSFPVLKGITKRGYKIPTPIQRKVGSFFVLYVSQALDYSGL